MTNSTATIRCNNCMTYFNDDADLERMTDEEGEAMDACPTCKTDAYLMDLGDTTMTTAKPQHTPGPWHFSKHNIGEYCGDIYSLLGKNKEGIMQHRTIAVVLKHAGAEESEANARLIAAAPELLEVLKYAVEQLEAYKTTRVGIHHAAIEKSRAAIAKATGKDVP